MYRGYIAVKNKKAIEPFKDVDNLRTLDEVKDLEGYAGVLADDSILIDVDDADQAELLMDIVEDKQLLCRVYETTRGMHFVFKNNGVAKNATDARIAIGINADIKCGHRNSYQVLKNNGEKREIIYDIFEDESIQELPKWLFPVDSNVDFLNLGEGDGRNQTLFSYILTLQKNEFTDDEARETLQVINDYVLSEPLDQSELETIYREDAFSDEVFYGGQNGNKFLAEKFANYLMNKHHIKRINGELHIYENGLYINNKRTIEKAMTNHVDELHSSTRREVMQYLEIKCDAESKAADANYISFRNGVLDIFTDELHPHDPKFVITNRIPWDYNPNAYDEITDNTLNNIACQDEGIRLLLEEVVGYTFYRRNELGKVFILTGRQSNGKSTYLTMIRHLLSKENVSALDLSELNQTFLTAEIAGKLANIGDDIDNDRIQNTHIFKKLATGDTLTVQRKHEQPFDFDNYAKLMFSANHTPQIGGGKDAEAVARRLILIPFNATFSSKDADYDPNIIDKLTSQNATEYFIKIAVEGLKRVVQTNSFTNSKTVQEETEKYERFADPVKGFIADFEEELNSILNVKGKAETDKVYSAFKKYHRDTYGESSEPLVFAEFCKQLRDKTQYKTKSQRITVDGIQQRVNFVIHK